MVSQVELGLILRGNEDVYWNFGMAERGQRESVGKSMRGGSGILYSTVKLYECTRRMPEDISSASVQCHKFARYRIPMRDKGTAVGGGWLQKGKWRNNKKSSGY